MDDFATGSIWLGRMVAITTVDSSATKVCGRLSSSPSSSAGAQTAMAGTAVTTA